MKRDRPSSNKSSSLIKKARINSKPLIQSNTSQPSNTGSKSNPPTQSALKGGRLKAAAALPVLPTPVSSPPPPAPKPTKAKTKAKPKPATTPPEPRQPPSPPTSIKIVFGTYENLLYGLHLTFDDTLNPTLTPLFHFRAHAAALTSLAISPSGTHLASGSATGPLTLWSLPKRRALGTLSPTPAGDDHQPGVAGAVFDPTGRLLAVADADEAGRLALYRTRDWALLRRLPGPIAALSFEPRRATLMLSVGRDRCLRLWDLSRQAQSTRRPIASVRLGAPAELVAWSPAGDLFVVVTGSTATVYDTKMAPQFTFRSPRGRVHDAKFLAESETGGTSYLVLGCDDGIGRVFELGSELESEPSCVAELNGHTNRVRALELVKLHDQTYAITISSDGYCHVYLLKTQIWKTGDTDMVEPLCRYDTKGCRLTCLAAMAVVSGGAQTEKEDEHEEQTGDSLLNLDSDDDDDEDEEDD